MLPPLQGLPHGLSFAAPAPCCVAAAVVAVAAAPPVTRLAAAGALAQWTPSTFFLVDVLQCHKNGFEEILMLHHRVLQS